MDKKKLQNDILEKPYDPKNWREVLKLYFGVKTLLEVPKPFERDNQEWKENVTTATELGNFYTADERQIGIYEVKLNGKPKIKIKRAGLRQLFKQVYSQEVDAALIVFIQGNKWRFSFVSEIRTEEGKRSTEPKRYTYLFGESEICRTAADRFDNLKSKSIYISDLFDAFNVDKLNKDFFKSYKEFFERFSEHLAADKEYRKILIGKPNELVKGWKDETAKPIRDFTKKLLGRIVFLQFLQKKGWMGVPVENEKWIGGDKRFIQNLYSKSKYKSTFHSKVLKTLFFETLNHKRLNDLAPFELGKDIKIPYLNGGLFDKDVSFHHSIDFPDILFKQLLDFFESYNFTIDENDPYDSEVGIDPEMLGHIFENLLEENREKGAFYTPKEIVHYMCQESLIQYLRANLPECTEDSAPETISIEDFIHKGFINDRTDKRDFIVSNAKKIEALLNNVKVCDPAIGSGAFPMGMLQEILKAKLNLNLTLDETKAKKFIIQNNIYGVDLENGAVEIARLRFWLSLIVNEEEPQPLPNLDYKIMQGNSLLESFGNVDLSELNDDDNDDIIFANKIQYELGAEFSAKRQSMLMFDKIEKNKLYEIIEKYFDFDETKKSEYKSKEEIKNKINSIVEGKLLAKFYTRKEKVHAEIDQLKSEIIANAILANELDGPRKIKEKNLSRIKKLLAPKEFEFQDLTNKLALLKELEEGELAKPYFLWHTWFKKDVFVNNGFDIVIGNPPYIQLQKEAGYLAKLYEEQNFKTFERTGDIYSLFYEKGVQLLNEKGILCYITSNKWMRTNYGTSTRQFFAQNTYPLILIDFGNIQVFETATVDTNILLLKNKPKAYKYDSIKTFAVRLDKDLKIKENSLAQYVKTNGYYTSPLNENSWIIGESDIYDIKKAIEKQGEVLGTNWNIKINYGIKTGLNDAFIINKETRDKLVKKDSKSTEILRPILRGRDFSSWYPVFGKQWLINSHNGVKDIGISRVDVKKEYPAVYDWLNNHFEELAKRKDHGYDWTNLRNCAYIFDFEKPKIMYPNMTKYLPFIYDKDDHYFSNDKSFIITGDFLQYLVCFFNSKLFKYCFIDYFPELQGGTRELRKVFFEKIPVKKITVEEEIPFQRIVDYIICCKKELLTESEDQFMLIYFEQIANGLIYEKYFEEEFAKNKLNIARYIKDLPVLNDKEEKIQQLRKIYITVSNQEHPVNQAIFSMTTIPQIALINNVSL